MNDRPRTRPDARAVSVEDLLSWVRQGRIRLPHFQRGLRWKRSHVRDLFDSVYRGYPIGGLLLSQQAAGSDVLHFGTVRVEAEPRSDALFVVDGQQRISSLAAVLDRLDPVPKADLYALWFDLSTREFHHLHRGTPGHTWIPLNVLNDSTRLLKWLNRWPLRTEREDLVDAALELGKSVREYRIPAYVLDGATSETLRIVFKRTNRSGVEMTEDEVFDAINESEGQKPLDLIQKQVANLGFGMVPKDQLYRAHEVVSGSGFTHGGSDDESKASADQIKKTEASLLLAVQFLVVDCGIPHFDLLPYRLLLWALARYFAIHPAPSHRSRLLLVRWVWRGCLSQHHANTNDASARAIVKATEAEDGGEAVQKLLNSLPEFPAIEHSILENEVWSWGSAITKVVALSLLHLQPRDPITSLPIALEDVQDAEEPRSFFTSLCNHPSQSWASTVVVWPRESRKGPTLLETLRLAPVEVQRSHALDATIIDSFLSGNVDEALRLRFVLLRGLLSQFIRAKAEPEDGDRPAIGEIIRGHNGVPK